MENGIFAGAVSLITDITERKQAEDDLRLSEERYRRIVETAREGIVAFDSTWHITFANARAGEIFGYDPDEMPGKSVDDFVLEWDRPAFMIRKAQRIDGIGGMYEGPFRKKNGSPVWTQNSAAPWVESGKFAGAFIMVTDVTERKKAEEAVRLSEARYRNLVESQFDIIARSDPSGKLSFINDAYCRTFGATRDQLLGSSFIPTVIQEDLPITLEALEAIKKPPYRKRTETRHLTPAGIRWFSWENSAVVDDSGKIIELQGVGRDITERKQAEEKVRRQIDNLRALTEIQTAISSSFGLEISLGTVLSHVLEQLRVDAACIQSFDPVLQTLAYVAGRGFRSEAFKQAPPLLLGEGYAGRAVLERRTIQISNLAAQNDHPRLAKAAAGEAFETYFGVPLITKGEVQGVLEIFQRAPLQPDDDWLAFLQALAGQAAIAIDNATLFERLQHSHTELRLAYDATIEGWSHAMDLRDKETEGHTQRVTNLSMQLAQLFALGDEELVQARRGALLHDIGKMGIPDHILFKSGPLSPEEWDLMRKHPQFAYEMLSPIRYLQGAVAIPYCHHEKWDGSGYPRGLKGEQIPLEARIFAVVDVWDALTSDRPYRAAWSREKALEHIRSEAGTHFDPQVAKTFLKSGLV
jgi:PAS domain S-box-containing protein/putative nucleotidyltransferase with HDIG domain